MKKKISVIIPFYKGNEYLPRALKSVEAAREKISDTAETEVVIINDSPEIEVALNSVDTAPGQQPDVKVIKNEKNLGIQHSRVNGLKYATGDYILFLDQDDELLAEGFEKQLSLIEDHDIVVGNGDYSMGKKNFVIYKSPGVMEYLIQTERFIKIRNLIPSPGECLIRKEAIPEAWKENILETNGADDWMLWLMMFKSSAKFAINPMKVYKHNDSLGENASANLDKMRVSAHEANEILKREGILTDVESESLKNAIEFKYLQDSGQLKPADIWKYRREIINNIVYKIKVATR